MHVQIINFKLKDLTDEQYGKAAVDMAQSFASVPGLVSKVWIANPSTNTYGGVYYWQDKAAMETFAGTDLFKSVATHPNLVEITSTDFEIMEQATRITRGAV
jgi:hypothetical protein